MVLLYVPACFWALVGLGVVGDEYEASIPFPFHVAYETSEVLFEFSSPSTLVDVVAYAFARPEEADEDVDPPVHAWRRDLALRSLKHPSRGNDRIQTRPGLILEGDQCPLFCRADATCL